MELQKVEPSIAAVIYSQTETDFTKFYSSTETFWGFFFIFLIFLNLQESLSENFRVRCPGGKGNQFVRSEILNGKQNMEVNVLDVH